MLSYCFSREWMVCVSQSSSDLELFGDVMLLVHWYGLATPAYKLLDGSVAGPSTSCLASWKGMLFWNFILRIYLSVFHLGQILLQAGWSPSQFAHFVSFWRYWSSWPGCPHFARFCPFLQNLLLWPYFWQLNHRLGLGIYTFVFRMRRPTFISFGISWPFIVKIYESAGINRPSFRLFILSTFVTPCDFNSFWISSPSMPASSWHLITHLE